MNRAQLMLSSLLMIAAVVLYGAPARAASSPPGYPRAFNRADSNAFHWLYDANRSIAAPGGGGVPAASSVPPGGAPLGVFSIGHTAGGLPQLSTRADLPLGNGSRSAPIDVVAKIPAASFGAALARFAVRATPVLSTAYALAQFLAEIKVSCSWRAALNMNECVEERQGGGLYWLAGGSGPQYPSASAACAGWLNGRSLHLLVMDSDTQGRCYASPFDGVPVQGFSGQQSVTVVPISEGDLASKIASQSGWPSSSKIDKALSGAIQNDNGVQIERPTVSGPATVNGGTSTTINNAGDITTNSTVYNITYNNDTTTTTTTTNVGTNPAPPADPASSPASAASSSTTSDQDREPAPTDTDLPPVPKLYERRYPDGITGVWNNKKVSFTQSPVMQLTSQLLPTGYTTGTCPTWSLPLDLATWASYGNVDASIPCYVWDFLRVVVLIGAVIAARALVFGG